MSDILGAVMAGGQSTRYGSPKALAEVGGRRVVDRVADSLRVVTDDVVVIANDAELAQSIGLPWRKDRTSGMGPLAGLETALIWAEERELRGIVAVACDMPFLPGDLLALVVERASATAADAVLPESASRRGIEPLAAYYAVSCLPAIAAAAARDDHRLIAFHGDVRVERIALADVRAFGDPERLFMNINTTTDRAAADASLSQP